MWRVTIKEPTLGADFVMDSHASTIHAAVGDVLHAFSGWFVTRVHAERRVLPRQERPHPAAPQAIANLVSEERRKRGG